MRGCSRFCATRSTVSSAKRGGKSQTRTAPMRLAFGHLPSRMIVAEGLSYEEAAQVCGVAVGTIKSRVNRARERLARLLALEDAEDLGPDRVTQAALQTAI